MSTIWHVYVIRTEDNCLYTGIATDVERRFQEHQAQSLKTAKYLRAHRPKVLAFTQAVGSRSLASKVELNFKKLSKARKERVVASGKLTFDPDSGRIS